MPFNFTSIETHGGHVLRIISFLREVAEECHLCIIDALAAMRLLG